MKFAQLSVGTRFRFRGGIWCKTGPLAAAGPAGEQRMIPRSAVVEMLDDAGTAPPLELSLEQALELHHRTCSELLHEAATAGPGALDGLQRRLDQAHAALVAAIG